MLHARNEIIVFSEMLIYPAVIPHYFENVDDVLAISVSCPLEGVYGTCGIICM